MSVDWQQGIGIDQIMCGQTVDRKYITNYYLICLDLDINRQINLWN